MSNLSEVKEHGLYKVIIFQLGLQQKKFKL